MTPILQLSAILLGIALGAVVLYWIEDVVLEVQRQKRYAKLEKVGWIWDWRWAKK